MKQYLKNPSFYCSLSAVIVLGLIISSYVFGWTTPTANPPAGNITLPTSSPSVWSVNGTNIYYNTGNVGIGTTTPSEKLTVSGDINILGNKLTNLATPNASSDAATKGYVDAATTGGVCYTAYGTTTCAPGFSVALSGYSTVYGMESTYGISTSLTCSAIPHNGSQVGRTYWATSYTQKGNLLNDERCVICCK